MGIYRYDAGRGKRRSRDRQIKYRELEEKSLQCEQVL